MKEILRLEKICIEGPDYEKELLLKGLDAALTKYFQVTLDELYSDTGKLKLLIIDDKEHDSDKVYERTKHLLTQHVTIQQIHECKNIGALIRTCLRCLCIRNDLYYSRLTLVKELPKSFRTFIYGNIDGDIYSLSISKDGNLKVRRCKINTYSDAKEYLRSMQANTFMAMEDSSAHLYTIRDTGQPAIPPIRPEIKDYNNRCRKTKDKVGALFNYSWTIEHDNFFYISGYSLRDNRSPMYFPHIYEIHPINQTIMPDHDEVFSLTNVGFVRSDQDSAVMPWGFKFIREYTR